MTNLLRPLGLPHPDRSFTLALVLEPSAIDVAILAYRQWRENSHAFWPPTGHVFADCILDRYQRVTDPGIPFTLCFNGHAWGPETTTPILVSHLLMTVFPVDRISVSSSYALLWPESLPLHSDDLLRFWQRCEAAITTLTLPENAQLFPIHSSGFRSLLNAY
jgi:hypothetical protein